MYIAFALIGTSGIVFLLLSEIKISKVVELVLKTDRSEEDVVKAAEIAGSVVWTVVAAVVAFVSAMLLWITKFIP